MTRNLVTVGEHTIDDALLTPGGWVLDAGCRDFTFARGMVARGCNVIAIDADPTVEDPGEPGIIFLNAAVMDAPGERQLMMSRDPQARYILPPGLTSPSAKLVKALTIVQIMAKYGVLHFDVVKLDIEGSEYDILKNWSPIATQLSVEFHEHVRPRPQSLYDEIFKHLSQWYSVAQHFKEARMCCAPNFWDTLLILREAQ